MPDVIHTADGREIPVTSDPTEVRAYATALTVSTKQTASFMEFNSKAPFASIKSEVRPAVDCRAEGAIDALRAECERLRRVVGHSVTAEVEAYREEIAEPKGMGR